jgi:crossover junction endodeoxyribonuclease RusA
MTTLLAPIPPSTNALWRAHRKGVRRSRRYLAWLKEAAWEVKLQKPPRFTGPVEIQIAIGRPDQRKRDLDNVATKALLDLLVQLRVIADDSLVSALAARWDDTIAPGRIAVTIAAAN